MNSALVEVQATTFYDIALNDHFGSELTQGREVWQCVRVSETSCVVDCVCAQ